MANGSRGRGDRLVAGALAARRSRQHRSGAHRARRGLRRIGPARGRDARAHDRPRARRRPRRHLLRAAQQGRAQPRRLEIRRRAPDVCRAHAARRLLRRNERDRGVFDLPRHFARGAARGGRPDHARARRGGDRARRYDLARDRHRAAAHRGRRAQPARRRKRAVRRRGDPHHPPDCRKDASRRHRLRRADPLRRDLPEGLEGRIRRRRDDVSRPGPDRDQAARLQQGRDGDGRPENRLHDARGGTDPTARPIAHKLSELFGQQVIVDNRPGAAGNIATDIVAKASPDGYTILMGTIAALAINPSLYQNLPFDPERDLAPVTQAVDSTNILSLHPSVPANSVKELIALARSKSLNYGSSGVGATGHLAGELFNLMTGVKLVHVPYKGGAPAMVDLVAGRVELVFATAASAVPQIKAGKIKGIAVTTAKRSALMPELPTIAEAGLAGYDANNWYGLMVPASTPRAIVDRLNAETVKVLNMPDVKSFLFNQGLEAAPSTPEEFGAYIRSERAKWAKIVKASGAKAE